MKTKLKQYRRTIPADLETPVGIYLKVRDLYPQSALLESSDYHAQHNATSFIGVEPIGSFKVVDGEIVTTVPTAVGGETRLSIADGVDVVEELRNYIENFDIEDANPKLPDGLLGYTAYDAVRYFEDVEIQPKEEKFAGVPDRYYVLYRFLIEVNHYKNEMTCLLYTSPSPRD